MKIGLIEQDIVNLISYKKYGRNQSNFVCNQLSMVNDFVFHEFWWKMPGINPELYWELQYEWLDHPYFRTGVFKERMFRSFKKLRLLNMHKVLLQVSVDYISWVMWDTTVKTNYQIYVKIPYSIRNL